MPTNPPDLIIDHNDNLPVPVTPSDDAQEVDDDAAELADLVAAIATLKDDGTELIVSIDDNA